MAYELNDGQGSLFQDTSDRKKDYSGKCIIGGQMYWISGWKKPGRDGKSPWLSLAFEPAQKGSSTGHGGGRTDEDLEIPF